jgi:predicted aldo/keto reductase-like oxidoreductase
MTVSPFFQTAFQGRQVCRLGLAAHSTGHLEIADVLHALDHGINFLNWSGTTDAISRAVAELGSGRQEVMVCVQFGARSAADAASELRQVLTELRTNYVDVLTLYYLEEASEWEEIIGPSGALGYLRSAQRDGAVRCLGVTTHQRPLAATIARSRLLDMLMIRYNAAHRGAEQEVFPVTRELRMPVVAYTCLRWGALLRETVDDPPGFVVPRAPFWYRFVLQEPAVTVALTAPDNRAELEENLTLLDAPGPLNVSEYQRLAEHGQRVRLRAGQFP